MLVTVGEQPSLFESVLPGTAEHSGSLAELGDLLLRLRLCQVHLLTDNLLMSVLMLETISPTGRIGSIVHPGSGHWLGPLARAGACVVYDARTNLESR